MWEQDYEYSWTLRKETTAFFKSHYSKDVKTNWNGQAEKLLTSQSFCDAGYDDGIYFENI